MMGRSDPAWLLVAYSYEGMKEVPGPRHSPIIQRWLRDLNAWWSDDETPWCGTFVAHCLQETELPIPSAYYRAKAWAEYGANLRIERLSPGAILVFTRAGGGHVGFYVGENETHYYVLGGNQSNGVNTTRIAKERLIASRWPKSVPVLGKPVYMYGGYKVSTNEA